MGFAVIQDRCSLFLCIEQGLDIRAMKEARSLTQKGVKVTIARRSTAGKVPDEIVDGVRLTAVPVIHGGRDLARSLRLPQVRQPLPLVTQIVLWLFAILSFVLGYSFSAARITRGWPWGIRYCMNLIAAYTARPTQQFLSYHLFACEYLAQLPNFAKPDIVHAHDLYTLRAAVMISSLTKANVVYDAHELEAERRPGTRPLLRWWIKREEKKLAPKAARVMTVSPMIAAVMADELNISTPALILNAPPTGERAQKRIREVLDLKPDVPLVVFCGKIFNHLAQDHQTSLLAHAVIALPGVHLAFVGTMGPVALRQLHEWQQREGGDRLHHIPPVPLTQLVDFLSGADVGCIVMPPSTKNTDLAMPNKLFEYITAGLQILSFDNRQIRATLMPLARGVFVQKVSVEALKAGLQQALDKGAPNPLTEKQLYRFSWQAQAEKLEQIYQNMFTQGDHRKLNSSTGALASYFGPLRVAFDLLHWIMRDPVGPSKWKIMALSIGVFTSQYAQALVIALMAMIFAGNLPSFPGFDSINSLFGAIDIKSEHLIFLLVFIYLFQSLVQYYCRTKLVSHAMDYYRANMKRALNYYNNGFQAGGAGADPLLDINMLAAFCVREARYLSGAFLSFANTLTGILSLIFGLSLLFYLNWMPTALLVGAVILLGLTQALVLKQGLNYSRDILDGSGELVVDIKEFVANAKNRPGYQASLNGSVEKTLDVAGAQRFLGGYENRLTLSYKNQLLLQVGFAIILGLILSSFLIQMNQGAAKANDIMAYCVFLLPVFAACIAVVNAIVGITTSRPYFEDYLEMFNTLEKQSVGPLLDADSTLPKEVSSPNYDTGAKGGWVGVFLPVDTLEWSTLIRLQSGLVSSGVLHQDDRFEDIVLAPQIWPDRIPSIEQFFDLKSPFDPLDLAQKIPTLLPFAEEVQDTLSDAQDHFYGHGEMETSLLSPRHKALICFFAAMQKATIFIWDNRVFGTLGERDRITLYEACPDLRVCVVQYRSPEVIFKPQLKSYFCLFPDPDFCVPIDPDALPNMPDHLVTRLKTTSVTMKSLRLQDNFLE